MQAAQGVNPFTRLRHSMRMMRAQYMENVKNKRCRLDKASLAQFDETLRRLDAESKALSRQC